MNFTQHELLDKIRLIVKEELQQQQIISSNDDGLINIQKASKLTGLAIQTIYGKCSLKLIPHYKKGKFLYFKKLELIKWIEEGKQFHYKKDKY